MRSASHAMHQGFEAGNLVLLSTCSNGLNMLSIGSFSSGQVPFASPLGLMAMYWTIRSLNGVCATESCAYIRFAMFCRSACKRMPFCIAAFALSSNCSASSLVANSSSLERICRLFSWSCLIPDNFVFSANLALAKSPSLSSRICAQRLAYVAWTTGLTCDFSLVIAAFNASPLSILSDTMSFMEVTNCCKKFPIPSSFRSTVTSSDFGVASKHVFTIVAQSSEKANVTLCDMQLSLNIGA
mmetsp:Transcript_124117/g.247273  ORF Transcript_124117/g.247273 Transcript_124117/m.247273 type:complete len:241 (-) Transcript_124117:239-961(-)